MISADDRLAIIDVVHRWSHVADASDAAGLRLVMTVDAVFSVDGGETLSGRDAVEIHLTEQATTRGVQTRRHVRNTVFDTIEGDRVSTRSYYLLTGVGATGFAKPLATGIYEDEVVRTADGWRIQRRIAHPDGQGDGIRA